MKRFPLWSVLIVAVVTVACSGDSGGSDKGAGDNPVVADVPLDGTEPDAGDPGIATDVSLSEVADALGDLPVGDLPSDPGELPPYENGATAFVSTSLDQLASGPMATGTLGDLVLKNRFVRFVVRNQEQSLYNPYPGSLVDADRVRPDGEAGNEQFFELFPMIGFGRVFKPSKMEIVDDGAFSGTAVVRFSGTDGGISLIDSILQTTSAGLEATVDYILGPDAHSIEVVTRVKNVGGLVDPIVVGQVLVLGKRLVKFHDVCGANASCLSTSPVRWLAGSQGDVSYALTVPGPGALQMLLNVEDIMVLQSGSYSLAVGEETTVRQFLVVGDGTIDDATRKARELRGEPAGVPVTVDVALSDPESTLSSAFVQVHEVGAGDGKGWVAGTTPGPDGKAIVHLLPGEYDVSVRLPGAPDATVPAITVTDVGADPVSLTANAAGWMRVRVKDPEGNSITAALTLQSGHGAALGASAFGYRAIEGGDRAFPIEPGNYTANVSRGLVWTLDRHDVTVEAGKVVVVDAVVAPAVDTTGFRMVNSHEHTEWSADSQTTVEDRVWNAIANGVDVMIATDHDHFGTRQPTIEALGLTDQVHSITGCEVSPMWGHSTAAGCRKPPAYETYYSVDFVEYDETGTMTRLSTAAELHKQAREEFDCVFLGVNHPYRSEGTFNLYKIDGTSDPALAEPDLDLHLVDAMEVYNKSDDIDSIQSSNLPAWFNLLNRGYSIAAIGGSDEHEYAGTYGSPRNMVPTTAGLNDADLPDKVFDAMKTWRSLMLGGPVVVLTVDGATLGDTVTATDQTVEVRVQVLAPDWMKLNMAKVFANGAVVREIELLPGPQVVRADETFELPLVADAHIVAAAGSNDGSHRMQPVSSRMPFSVTNPIFVDVGGDGYTPIHKNGAPWDAAK